MPSNQKQIIEQAKFTFEKQTKTIEDQGKKQIKALEEHGKQLINSSSEKDSLELLKQNEIFDEVVNERRFEINNLSGGIDLSNLTHYYTGKSAPKFVLYSKGLLIIYNDIKNGLVSLQKEEKNQEELKGEI